mgnify:CR=1 FL=1
MKEQDYKESSNRLALSILWMGNLVQIRPIT